MPEAVQKRNRKRPGSSQAGPKAKKAHAEKPDVKGKKRSQPVTAPPRYEDEEESSADEEVFEDGLEGDDIMEEDAVPEAAAQSANKDPNAARESHKAQKVLQEQRKAAKPHSSLLIEAKRAWGLARQKNISKTERAKHVHALMNVVRGKVHEIVFKHDASRIIQTVVKYGGQKERNEIAIELKGKYKELAQSKYSKFLVSKLIRFCPTHRTSILQEFQGSILRLVLHREASSVLADAFELWGNAYERSLLLQDFYGKEATLLTMTQGSEQEKENSKKGLKGLLEGVEPERRKRVLSAVQGNLTTIFNNSDKGAVSHALVHRVFWEYLCAINELEDVAEREKLRREMFESCQDTLAEIVHTKDGSRVVREFIAQGTAKDRKQIVKTLKPHVERMCKDDEAQLVLFTALDIIDDTKLTGKSLVADIVASASTLYTSPQGRRSLIYLVSPRTRRHFTPAQINLLAETDAARSQTSKKDDKLRTEEVCKAASESLLSWITKNGADIMRDPGGSLVVTEVMLYSEGDKSAASESLLNLLAAPYPSSDPANPHIITLPHASRVYKTLLQGGPFSHDTKEIVRSPLFSSADFANQFVGIVGMENTLAMARDDGAFIVAVLCERAAESDELRKTLKGWFTAELRKELEKEKDRRGRTVLLQQIASLS
ncbi:ARM repeat-containing protein [Cytidiella melzeri]|nr:ARM repeat-containing protein [Cytidiella melzeri]